MAKCTICNSRKGKRKCIAADAFICSLCCGETRNFEKCDGCSYFKDTKSIRNYKKAPHFPLSRMSNDPKLQDVANVIESTICQFDEKQNNNLDDNIVLRIIELLLDKHYFNDEKIAYKNKLEEEGANSIDQAINEELKNPSSEDLSKILGTIYRSVKRHTSGHREYLDFIHDHVGIRLGKGARLIRKFFKK
jgi:hypothetical protein